MTPENAYNFHRDIAQQDLDAVLRAITDWRESHGTQRLINARWGLQCYRRWHHARLSERAAWQRMIRTQCAGLFTPALAAE